MAPDSELTPQSGEGDYFRVAQGTFRSPSLSASPTGIPTPGAAGMVTPLSLRPFDGFGSPTATGGPPFTSGGTGSFGRLFGSRSGGMSQGEALGELTNIARTMPAIALSPYCQSDVFAEAAFSYLRELALHIRDLCIAAGIDVETTMVVAGQSIPRFDFNVPTYEEVVRHEKELIAAIGAEFLISLRPPGLSASIKDWTWKDWLAKILDLLGLGGLGAAVGEVISGNIHFQAACSMFGIGEFKQAMASLGECLSDLVGSAEAMSQTATAVGKAAAKLGLKLLQTDIAAALAKLAAKALPVIGWALMLAQVLVGLSAQYINSD